MSYVVHNFQDGQIIFASPINEMDAQIKKNEEDIEKRILEPALEGNNGQALVTDGHGGRKWSDVASADYIGDKNNLTTQDKSTIVAAINEVDGDVGDLSTLKTPHKDNLVNAANDLFDDVEKIGNLNNLKTDAKDHIVPAINELIDIIGGLNNLTTDDKSSVVKAIDELVNVIGGLDNLTTEQKSSVVNAINELVDNIGNLDNLDTEEKDSIVEALNEVVDNIGDLDDLKTDDQDSIVDAINEVHDLVGIAEKMIAQPYNKDASYEIGDVVTKDDKLWRAKEDMNPAGEWAEAKWETVDVDTLIREAGNIEDIEAMIAFEYDENETYVPYDVVIHEHKLYLTLEDAGNEPWDENKWIEINVTFYLKHLDSLIDHHEMDFAPIYEGTGVYDVGDLVMYEDYLYRARHFVNGEGAWQENSWERINLASYIKEIRNDMVDDFDVARAYNVGDVVSYDNKLYECTEAVTTPGPFVPTHWQQTTILEQAQKLFIKSEYIKSDIADAYDTLAEYNEGDVVMYGDILYKAKEDMNPAGQFNPDKWQHTTVNELIGAMEGNTDIVAEQFDNAQAYEAGDAVVHDGKLYVAKEDIAAGDWDATKWEQTNVDGMVDSVKDAIDDTQDMISDEYDNTATYAEGDIVIYNNKLYKCKEDIDTAEDFDPAKWDVTKITNLLGGGEPILTDTVTGIDYKLIVENGIIAIKEV